MKKIILTLLLISIPTYALSTISFNENGAISDNIYYQIGGGAVVIPSFTRNETNVIGLGVSWKSNLMCGNFDINTTIRNQLNGATSGFKNLMGNVIQNATGAVMSMPAMIIQRANPQLYDLLTNGVLQGKLDFSDINQSCENMANKMADYAQDAGWLQLAKTENFATIASKEKDAVRAKNQADKEAGNNGVKWVGGKKHGGINQKPIKIVSDTAIAGYNLLNQRDADATSVINNCKGTICETWEKPSDAAEWLTKVTGEQQMVVCSDCNDTPKTQSGVGLNPLIREEQERIAKELVDLVNGNKPVNAKNLSQVNGGSLQITRGLIEAVKDDPEADVLVAKLSGEMAASKVIEEALMARRILLAGMKEPNINKVKEAQDTLHKTLEQLDQEIEQLKLEIEMKKMFSGNTAKVILDRQQMRILNHQQKSKNTDVDKQLNNINKGNQ